MARIVIVNENESEQKLVRTILARQSDFEVVGYGKNGYDALTLVIKLKPDIMIMDTRLSDTNEIELIPLLKSKSPHTAFLILTSHTETTYISKIIDLGITAYLHKETDMDTLPQAIKTLLKGEYFFSPKIHDKVVHTLLDMIKTKKASDKPSTWLKKLEKMYSQKSVKVKFTAIEQQALSLAIQGCLNKEIAARLRLCDGTVRNYFSAMLKKTGKRSRTQLAVFAVNNELLSQPFV